MLVKLGKYPGPKSTKERKIEVRIDPWDIWSLDQTLALIIHPALVLLKEKTHGAPDVPDSDVPDELKATPKENEWDTDSNHFKRWDYVLDEMIWAFGQVNLDWKKQFFSGDVDRYFEEISVEGETLYEWKPGPNHTFKIDYEGMKIHEDRMQNGFRLFGKFFQNLWD